ncbi:MAG: TraB/GumN family protein, partial [Chitinophagaceae bacterium]|nr:TraB/GumN family protein [Chitinophagaceae bacterium]
MNRRVFCVWMIIGLLTADIAFTQSSIPHTLLWRISGKGMQSPSYLFGTLHLNDKRLFHFSDSVYAAIEHTSGLAIELNPDELGAYFMNGFFEGQTEKSKSLRELLGREDYQKYNAAVAKKLNKPAADINASDILREKNKWVSEYMEKGEMPTFVDAYLYNLARKQGKWLGGIEDISDQFNAMEDLVDKSDVVNIISDRGGSPDSMMEMMIHIYAAEDLDAIDQVTNLSKNEKDNLLIKRNYKMARRMDSLSAFRSMFFAVGAAHLPGDSGVIALLRQRGFTVEPVISARKLDPSSYTVKEVQLPWTQYTDSAGAYKIAFPANPATIKIMGLINLRFYFDIFNLTAYWSMAAPVVYGNRPADSIYSSMARGMFKGKKGTAGKKVMVNGVEGREYTDSSGDAKLRLRLFLHDKTVYMVMSAGTPRATSSTADLLHFMNSFEIMENAGGGTDKAFVFQDSVMGVRFSSPAKLDFNAKLSTVTDKNWLISSYTGADNNIGAYIMIFSKEVRPGYYITNDSLIHTETFKLFKNEYANWQVRDREIDGISLKEFVATSLKQPNVKMRGYSIVRFNRNILLLTAADSTSLGHPSLDGIFRSFHFIEPGVRAWRQETARGGSFSARAPAPFQLVNLGEDGENEIAYDTLTATSYTVAPDTLSKYRWSKTEDDFWKKYLKTYEGEKSLVSEEQVSNGPLKGYELVVHTPGTKFYQRMRLLLSGNIVYKLVLSSERSAVYDPESQQFFNSFRLIDPKPPVVTVSKTKILLDDLASSDSTQRYKAGNFVKEARFPVADTALVFERLFDDFQSMYLNEPDTYGDISGDLARAVAHEAPDQLADFIASRYRRFAVDKAEHKKALALQMLSGIKTRHSYETLVRLMELSVPAEMRSYRLTANLSDSLALTASVWPGLAAFLKDTAVGIDLANTAKTLLDSGYLKPSAALQSDAIALTGSILPGYRQDSDGSRPNLFGLIGLLKTFKTPAANEALRKLLSVSAKYYRMAGATALIGNNQPVPVAVLNKLA